MKSVIIVDDEYTTRIGLAEVIKKTGRYKILATCSNGNDALKYTMTLNPDIVITDIYMPSMDGIEYIKKCVEAEKYLTKFILISGYENFEYMRSALKLKVHDYISKPIDHNNLISVLDNTSKIIDDEILQKMLLHNQIGADALCTSSKNDNKTINYLEKTGITFSNIRVCVINMYFDQITSLEFIKNEIDKLLSKNFLSFLSFWYKKRIVILLSDDTNSSKYVFSCFGKVSAFLYNMFKLSCIIGIGCVYSNIINIPDSYQEALYALTNNIYEKVKTIIIFKSQYIIETDITKYFAAEKTHLFTDIENCNRERAYEIVESLFQKILVEKVPPNVLFYLFNNMISNLYKIINNNSTSLPEPLDLQSDSDFILFKDKFEKSKSQFLRLIDTAINSNATTQISHYGYFIDRVIRYLNLNYGKNINLKGVCEYFNINISYFCKIFKDKTGMTYTQYLTDLRIKYAKEMLINKNIKVYEVAESVGFQDPKYFNKVFKKRCNITPSEYKEKMANITNP